MTERESLIELLNEAKFGVNKHTLADHLMSFAVEGIADYLLANGVVVPPCKVGDKVYEIEKECLGCIHFTDGGYSDFCECTLDDNKLMFEADFDKECVHKIIETKFMYSMIDKIGKTVFLTKEDAEKALAERSEGK